MGVLQLLDTEETKFLFDCTTLPARRLDGLLRLAATAADPSAIDREALTCRSSFQPLAKTIARRCWDETAVRRSWCRGQIVACAQHTSPVEVSTARARNLPSVPMNQGE